MFVNITVTLLTPFNSILVILWQSFLLVEEARVTGESTDLPSDNKKFYHIMVFKVKIQPITNASDKEV
jgi:hypothetical protein